MSTIVILATRLVLCCIFVNGGTMHEGLSDSPCTRINFHTRNFILAADKPALRFYTQPLVVEILGNAMATTSMLGPGVGLA